MPTTVYLVRSGSTKWDAEGKLVGRKDIGLTDVGLQQAKGADAILGPVDVHDFLASPLSRAVETAEIIARHHDQNPGRDPRLTDLDIGPWQGKAVEELENEQAYQDLLRGLVEAFPDGEDLEAARRRTVSSVEQAVGDNESESNIVMVTHCAPIQLILTYYLGMPVGYYHRFVLNPGSVTVLNIDQEMGLPKILGINLTSAVEVMVKIDTI